MSTTALLAPTASLQADVTLIEARSGGSLIQPQQDAAVIYSRASNVLRLTIQYQVNVPVMLKSGASFELVFNGMLVVERASLESTAPRTRKNPNPGGINRLGSWDLEVGS